MLEACGPARLARRGSTLVEVLAAIVILGSAATSVLVAQASSVERLRAAGRQLVARDLASELITTWRLKGVDLRVADAASVSVPAGWSWTRRAQEIELTEGVRAIRVELVLSYKSGEVSAPPWDVSFSWLVGHVDEK